MTQFLLSKNQAQFQSSPLAKMQLWLICCIISMKCDSTQLTPVNFNDSSLAVTEIILNNWRLFTRQRDNFSRWNEKSATAVKI